MLLQERPLVESHWLPPVVHDSFKVCRGSKQEMRTKGIARTDRSNHKGLKNWEMCPMDRYIERYRSTLSSECNCKYPNRSIHSWHCTEQNWNTLDYSWVMYLNTKAIVQSSPLVSPENLTGGGARIPREWWCTGAESTETRETLGGDTLLRTRLTRLIVTDGIVDDLGRWNTSWSRWKCSTLLLLTFLAEHYSHYRADYDAKQKKADDCDDDDHIALFRWFRFEKVCLKERSVRFSTERESLTLVRLGSHDPRRWVSSGWGSSFGSISLISTASWNWIVRGATVPCFITRNETSVSQFRCKTELWFLFALFDYRQLRALERFLDERWKQKSACCHAKSIHLHYVALFFTESRIRETEQCHSGRASLSY